MSAIATLVQKLRKLMTTKYRTNLLTNSAIDIQYLLDHPEVTRGWLIGSTTNLASRRRPNDIDILLESRAPKQDLQTYFDSAPRTNFWVHPIVFDPNNTTELEQVKNFAREKKSNWQLIYRRELLKTLMGDN